MKRDLIKGKITPCHFPRNILLNIVHTFFCLSFCNCKLYVSLLMTSKINTGLVFKNISMIYLSEQK